MTPQYNNRNDENDGPGKPDANNDIHQDMTQKDRSGPALNQKCASVAHKTFPAGLKVGPSQGDLTSPADAASLASKGESWPDNTSSASENGLLNVLRVLLFLLLISITVMVSIGIYYLTKSDEENRFEDHVGVYSLRIIDSFHGTISHRLSALGSMATAMTSHAISTNQQFPMVTLPHFELRGSDLRVQTDSFIIHYMPVVNETMRTAWEEYALENRGQIDEAFQSDALRRQRQDEELGFEANRRYMTRELQQDSSDGANNLTIIGDGTGFHPRIWSNGALTPEGDEPVGQGHYLPLWQRSPVSGARQRLLNLNFAKSLVFEGTLQALLEKKEAVINRAALPLPAFVEQMRSNIAVSQYRHEDFDTLSDDAVSYMAYPVMDSFEEDTQVVGVLGSNVFWRMIFARVLPESAGSFVCVLENSFNQTLSYRLDGPNAEYLGAGDFHDESYDYLAAFTDMNDILEGRRTPVTRSYTSVPLNAEFGKYTLRIYPTKETEDIFITSDPWLYACIVVAVVGITSLLFAAFSYFVERRQRRLTHRVRSNAEKAAAAERELNEYLAHEVRNRKSKTLPNRAVTIISFAHLFLLALTRLHSTIICHNGSVFCKEHSRPVKCRRRDVHFDRSRSQDR
eukprot:scaffold407_cov168-Amphora_coffeaeformis.AAC.8